MAENTGGLRRILNRAPIYSFVQQALGADAVRRSFLALHVKPAARERILDLGCGPGDVLTLLPETQYLGVDISPDYISAARARFGSRARFVCDDVASVGLDPSERFDAVISIGVFHHLDDEAADSMARLAARVLAPGGRFATLDPVRTARQARTARWLIDRDRGLNVRTPEAYRQLVAKHFDKVECTIHHDLVRVPYTHVALECREPRIGRLQTQLTQ